MGFRPDVDGLRAVAIVVVVAFHASVSGFSGGFIGVDVFFVISGWLITRNILRETAGGGRVDLPRFWARRIRRLVPGLSLMVVVTTAMSIAILPRTDIEQVAREGWATALYVSNFLFASLSQGYFAQDVADSPFLHTWSLSVEEQFYLLWPVLLGLTVLAVGSRGRHLRASLITVLGGVFLLSFAANLRLTESHSTWAFYGLFGRAWEFAAAGLLAIVGSPRALSGRGARSACAAIGMGLLVLATTTFSPTTPYPGKAALIPVGGALLLVISGDGEPGKGQTTITRFLSTVPLQWLGRVSYSWYLWHWPILVLTMAALDSDAPRVRAAAVGGSLGVAWLAYTFVEQPIRFRWRLLRGARRSLVGGVVVTGLTVSAVLGAAEFVSTRPTTPVDRLLAERRDRVLPECELIPIGEDEYCAGGAEDGASTVLLVGDSKAVVLFNAVSDTARRRDVRLVSLLTAGCPFVDVDVATARGRKDVSPQCAERRSVAWRMIEEIKPDAVLVAEGSHYADIGVIEGGRVVDDQTAAGAWRAGVTRMIEEVRASGARPGMFLDNPGHREDPNDCVARRTSVSACEVPRDEALSITAPLREAELDLVARLRVPHFDVTEELCDREACRVGTDTYLDYLDGNHLSSRSTMGMVDEIDGLLTELTA